MEHLPHLGNSMTRMAESLGKAGGDEEVPACRGWTINDVVIHLGTVHRWAAGIVLSGQRLSEPEVVATGPLVNWYVGTATALLAALQAVEPTESTPNFSFVKETASFWPRRQLHETTIHAVDVSQALKLGDGAFIIDEDVAEGRCRRSAHRVVPPYDRARPSPRRLRTRAGHRDRHGTVLARRPVGGSGRHPDPAPFDARVRCRIVGHGGRSLSGIVAPNAPRQTQSGRRCRGAHTRRPDDALTLAFGPCLMRRARF